MATPERNGKKIKSNVVQIIQGLVQVVPVLVSAYVHKLYMFLDFIGHPIVKNK